MQKTILVSQNYNRYVGQSDGEAKTAILLTDYDDMGLATIHLKAIFNDKYAAIILLKDEKHHQKILEMLDPSSAYK